MWNINFSVCQCSSFCRIVAARATVDGFSQCENNVYLYRVAHPPVSAVAADNSLLMAAGLTAHTTCQSIKCSVSGC
jgi:hypothetical protein